MKLPRRMAYMAAGAPLAAAATFAPGLALHAPTHVLPTSHQRFLSAPRLAGPSSGAVAATGAPIRRDPTFNPAVMAFVGGAAGRATVYTPAAVDFIVQMTKKLVTAAEDVAESSSSDSSSSGAPGQQIMKHLFPTGDQQFNVNQ